MEKIKFGYYTSEVLDEGNGGSCELQDISKLPSTIGGKIYIRTFSYESEFTTFGASYSYEFVSENKIKKLFYLENKITGTERNFKIKLVHNSIKDCLSFFNKHRTDKDASFYQRGNMLVCFWHEKEIALEITFSQIIPSEYLEMINSGNGINGFKIMLYGEYSWERKHLIENGELKKISPSDFQFIPNRIREMNEEILKDAECYYIVDELSSFWKRFIR